LCLELFGFQCGDSTHQVRGRLWIPACAGMTVETDPVGCSESIAGPRFPRLQRARFDACRCVERERRRISGTLQPRARNQALVDPNCWTGTGSEIGAACVVPAVVPRDDAARPSMMLRFTSTSASMSDVLPNTA
jgi:hypothetical protein